MPEPTVVQVPLALRRSSRAERPRTFGLPVTVSLAAPLRGDEPPMTGVSLRYTVTDLDRTPSTSTANWVPRLVSEPANENLPLAPTSNDSPYGWRPAVLPSVWAMGTTVEPGVALPLRVTVPGPTRTVVLAARVVATGVTVSLSSMIVTEPVPCLTTTPAGPGLPSMTSKSSSDSLVLSLMIGTLIVVESCV